jgi:hypothetical protein
MPNPVNLSRDSFLKEDFLNCLEENHEINFGQVALNDQKERIFILVNSNPYAVSIKSLEKP